jgi:tRNA uracil 4-sulfurtransferase
MKLVSLVSGGIDSPVASYIMAKAGAEIILLHMDNRPYDDDRSVEKVKLIAERLREVTGQEIPLYSADHGSNQSIIKGSCDSNYQCVMCKRVMQRTARELCLNLGAGGIVMGDSLGQVASQTLKNIRAENTGLRFPVVRPLIGWDKLEIEKIAKEIATYDLSIMPAGGCAVVPVKPITEARPDKVSVFDSKIDLDALAKTCADGAILI